MSRDIQLRLEALELLPTEETRTLADEILRRSLPWDSAPLADQIGSASDALLAALHHGDEAR